MEADLLRAAATQGPWAVLFVALLLYTMREAARREERLMRFLSELSDSLRELTDLYQGLCDDVCEIKRDVGALNGGRN